MLLKHVQYAVNIMNDFTKEELQYFLMVMKPFHWLWKDDPLELEKKIQSMIDDYCEMPVPTMANYCCKKCNEEWHQCECES